MTIRYSELAETLKPHVLQMLTDRGILADGVGQRTPQDLQKEAIVRFGGLMLGGPTSPGNIEVQRQIVRTNTNYTEVGTFTSANGTHHLRVTVTVDASGYTLTKSWVVATSWGATGGAWWFVPADVDTDVNGMNLTLAINQSSNALSVRLVYGGGPGGTYTHYVRIENVGSMLESFAELSGTGTMTVPTTPLATGLLAKTNALQLVRTIPTTVGNYVEIGYMSVNNGGGAYRITISNSDGGFAVGKMYLIPTSYNEVSAWSIVQPLVSTGPYSGSQEWELCVLQNNSNSMLRLVRSLGTTAGTAYITIQWEGAIAGSSWNPQSGTGTMGVPTVYAGFGVMRQQDGAVGIGGNIEFLGLARRIKANMDDATFANRLIFMPNVTNAAAFLGLMPDGSGTQSIFRAYGSSDPVNAPFLSMNITAAAAVIASNKAGTGVTVPLTFSVNGSDSARFSVNRAFWIGRTTAAVLADAVGMMEVEGSISVLTSTVHRAAAAPGSPLDGESWNDSTRKALSVREAGITQNLVGTIFTATADAAISNSAAELTLFGTGIGTLTLPANFWTQGKTVRVRMMGYWSQTGSSPTRTLKAKLGSTAIVNTALATFGGAVTANAFALDVILTCRTTGASGTVFGQGMVILEGNGSYGTRTTAAVTVDTTASGVLDVTWTFGTADVNNKVTVTNATVEVLN